MTDRYVTRPRVLILRDEYGEYGVTASEIILEEEDVRGRPTGLVNAQGNPIYRVRRRELFGFHGKNE
jgi:hypothetical protein